MIKTKKNYNKYFLYLSFHVNKRERKKKKLKKES